MIEPIKPDEKLSIEPVYGEILMQLVLETKPETIVEIGTGQGYSTSWMLMGLNRNQKGTIYTFDSVERKPYVWKASGIPDSRVKKINSVFEDGIKEIPGIVDFVFHDAGHFFEHVKEDLAHVILRIPKGGIVAVHDVIYSFDMGEKVKKMFEEMGWDYREYIAGCGMGVARKK